MARTRRNTAYVTPCGKGRTCDMPAGGLGPLDPTTRNNYVRHARDLFRTLDLPSVVYKGRLYASGEYAGGSRF